jgi:hypothetical protein
VVSTGPLLLLVPDALPLELDAQPAVAVAVAVATVTPTIRTGQPRLRSMPHHLVYLMPGQTWCDQSTAGAARTHPGLRRTGKPELPRLDASGGSSGEPDDECGS